MNTEKLFKCLQEEIAYIENEALKHSNLNDEGRALERIAKKVLLLKYLIICQQLSPIEIKNADIPFATKEMILELFDPKELIEAFLKKELRAKV